MTRPWRRGGPAGGGAAGLPVPVHCGEEKPTCERCAPGVVPADGEPEGGASAR